MDKHVAAVHNPMPVTSKLNSNISLIHLLGNVYCSVKSLKSRVYPWGSSQEHEEMAQIPAQDVINKVSFITDGQKKKKAS